MIPRPYSIASLAPAVPRGPAGSRNQVPAAVHGVRSCRVPEHFTMRKGAQEGQVSPAVLYMPRND